jgi:glycosyltransferase involved in cell wall biosynthesis
MGDSRRAGLPGPDASAARDRPLRIAHVIGYINIGGAERQFVDLLNAMPGADRLAVFTSADRGGGDLRGVLDPSIEQVEALVRRRSLVSGIRRLARVLRSYRCDVVHTHMYTANLYGSIAARLAGVPVIVTTEHGENRWKNAYHRFIERRVISGLADRRLCVSEAILRRRTDHEGVPREKLELMVNGTALPEEGSSPREGSVLTIGAVGACSAPWRSCETQAANFGFA